MLSAPQMRGDERGTWRQRRFRAEIFEKVFIVTTKVSYRPRNA